MHLVNGCRDNQVFDGPWIAASNDLSDRAARSAVRNLELLPAGCEAHCQRSWAKFLNSLPGQGATAATALQPVGNVPNIHRVFKAFGA